VTALGLDFGTTTTLLATDAGLVSLGPLREWMPSLVGFDDDGSILVGEAAETGMPGQTIRSIKRAITRRQRTIRVDAPWGQRQIDADEFIVAVLRETVRRAEAAGLDLSEPGGTTIGCPAIWDGDQRRRYLRLLRKAGIAARPIDLVDEPIAAGISWIASQPASEQPPPRAQRTRCHLSP